jgi:UDP-glucose 4-epimerase
MTYWTDRAVCVTGGAGMVGSTLCELLLAEGARVSVLDNFSRGKTRIDNVRYAEGDAGDQHTCEVEFLPVDVVFNLAAFVAGVTYNQSHNAEMFANNVRLQVTPVLAAKAVGVPRFVQVSSVCVYGEDAQNPCKEDNLGGEPTAANNGYAWAKRMGERTALWAGLKHVSIVRPANIYGVRDYFDDRAHVIPALIKKCLKDNEVLVNGTGDEVREFLYVTDAANAMMVVAENGQNGEAYNIGTDGATAYSVKTTLEIIQNVLETKKTVRYTGGKGGDRIRIVDSEKINKLGWQYSVNLLKGIQTVCDWYRK